MEDQAHRWWQVRWGLAGHTISRFAIVFGKIIGLLCLIAMVGYCAVYLLSPWLASQRLGKVDPRLSIIPVSLSSKVEVPLSNSCIDHNGFKFLLPNQEIVHTFESERMTTIRFRNGGLLMVPNTLQDAELFTLVNGDKRAERLLGQEILHSKFKLMEAAMSVTPEQVKWWNFRSSQNEREELLLVTKFIALSHSFSLHSFTIRPIYTIAFGDFRGFQFGNPDISPYDTHLDVFDGTDRHFEFDIAGPEGHGQVLTQEEINSLVASIRSTSDHRSECKSR